MKVIPSRPLGGYKAASAVGERVGEVAFGFVGLVFGLVLGFVLDLDNSEGNSTFTCAASPLG